MSKYTRYQSVVSRNTDEHISEDHWLKQFEKSLQKGAVQPKTQQSLFDQISSVMNGNAQSRYPSVQAAVDDMMQRSGLTNYLKVSNEDNGKAKVAADQNADFDKHIPVENKQQDTTTPDVIKENPSI